MVHLTLARSDESQAHLMAQLQEAANVDVLTGVSSRRAFDRAVEAALGSSGRSVSVLIVDLDHFKSVNDVHGHLVGDEALRHLAELLTVGIAQFGGLVGRLGGDEMGVMMIGSSEEQTGQRARELVRAVRREPLPTLGGPPLRLTISVGAALVVGGQRAALYAAADAALYASKSAGRDCASVSCAENTPAAAH